MAKKLFQKWLPKPEAIKKSKALSWVSHWLADGRLWHLNRHSVSTAVFIGLFCSFMPIPMQMLLAALIAISLRANVAISVVFVWISNPITMPILFYFAFVVGATITGETISPLPDHLTLSWLMGEIQHLWQPFLLGCLICGLFFATLGFLIAKIFWRIHVIRAWRKRHHKS